MYVTSKSPCGATITLPSGLLGSPQELAMLQAYYSRSHLPITDRLKALNEDTQGKIRADLAKWYAGYSHKSIAQTGNVTLFFEGVSMLTAKELQSHPLYNGQESSSRYINFCDPQRKLLMHSRLTDSHQHDIVEALLKVYTQVCEYAPALIRKLWSYDAYSTTTGKPSHAGYERTLKAMAFDVARGLLPACSPTQLSVSMTMDAMSDHLYTISHRGLTNESRLVAFSALQMLEDQLPSAFRDVRTRYREPHDFLCEFKHAPASKAFVGLLHNMAFSEHQVVQYNMPIDFGSWRDIQRHRAGGQQVSRPDFGNPSTLITNNWYTKHYKDLATSGEAPIHFADDLDTCLDFVLANKDLQVMPLLTQVCHSGYMPGAAFEYTSKLRTAETVHPTLRSAMFKVMASLFSSDKYADSANDIDTTLWVPATGRRGDQTILK